MNRIFKKSDIDYFGNVKKKEGEQQAEEKPRQPSPFKSPQTGGAQGKDASYVAYCFNIPTQ